jgi:pimeloyl-ACP methyl ester carboxylesterase
MSSNADRSFVSPAKGEPRLPDPGTNNLWYQDRGTDAALVFVHGILSDSRSCWLRAGPRVYWPDLVSRDCRFDRYSLYLGGYYTAIDAGAFKIQHCADELHRALARPDRPSASSVLDRATLVFVCHSTGGIVIRYLLESRASEFTEKTVGLVLIASPSFGSAWATKLSWLSDFYNAQLAGQLEWGNSSLDDLDERFHRLIKERRIPHLLGVEAYENHFVFHRKLLPDRLVVVDKNSAGRYFAPPHLLAKTDHFTCAKPDSERHPAHELLVDFCSELERYQRNQLGAIVARSPTDTRAEQRENAILHVGSALRYNEPHCIVVPATLVEGSSFAASLATLDLTLAMRETDQRVAVKTPPNIEIGRIARFLAASLLPHLLHRGYEWTIEHNSRELPSHHTLSTCGVQTGDVIYLAGNHRKPKVRPFEG